MGEMPFIGAKISLISKGDIRYEGTLYSIDMNESTIALQNGTTSTPDFFASQTSWQMIVRRCVCLFLLDAALSHPKTRCVPVTVKSFGTENRRPEKFLPPSDEIYEYIIFKGELIPAASSS